MTGTRIRVQGNIQTASLGGGAPVLPPRPNWQDRAACKSAWSSGLVEFIPAEREEAAAKALAKVYCNRCPVRAQCLASALKNKDYGVWAGTTKAQRDKLARTRDRAKCPGCGCKTLISVGGHDLCMACALSWKTERKPIDDS